MATKRKRPEDPVGNSFSIGNSRFDDLEDDQKVMLLSAHLEMMQNFMNFCKEKKAKCVQESLDKTKDRLFEEKQSSKRTAFKDKVTTYFGEDLPSHVVDSLCDIVEENSYDKCHYCSLPVESLVLSVVQILVDARQCTNEAQTTNLRSKAPAPNNNHDSVVEKSISTNSDNGRHPMSDKGHHQSADKTYNASGGIKSSVTKIKANTPPILDTPVVLLGDELNRSASVSCQQAPVMPMRTKSKPNKFVDKLRVPSEPSLHAPIENSIEGEPANELYRKSEHLSMKVSPEIRILKETKSNSSCLDLGKLADQLYNKTNVHSVRDHSHQLKFQPSNRFDVSETELRYYKVLCGLAKSKWSCLEGVKLYKTSVTYNSLGESIEPFGHVDNFFIAGYCRKLFDDSHPRESRKHFFYPRIGGCLLSYRSSYEVNTVKNSFLGANSALKLHLADKLCFPIFHPHVKHWSVFIVDLRQQLFVFLDSMFGERDSLQIHTRNSIIPAFKECWYEHAEVKLDLEEFAVHYPPVPKQNNIHDCGIFAIMFMESWDNNIDLRRVFDQSDIANIRVKVGNALFFSKKNTADKTLVQNLFDQGHQSSAV